MSLSLTLIWKPGLTVNVPFCNSWLRELCESLTFQFSFSFSLITFLFRALVCLRHCQVDILYLVHIMCLIAHYYNLSKVIIFLHKFDFYTSFFTHLDFAHI